MIGQTVSHYKITEKLGGGGMGIVYKAEDTRLGRNVALKFLTEELQQDSAAKKRFLREARSAAALDHPYICHIHEVGEAEGKSFICMEYVQGETLSQKLTEGPLPLENALQMAVEVAEALEAAHKNDIVHRDLKPANIMFTPEGHVKVMDFGLAKRVTPPDDQKEEITTALTKQSSTLGTVPYMSPEQIRGQEVDTRSDIFSFGVVLYEMLAGVNPFSKGGHMETAKAVLSDTAPPLTRYTEDIPLLLQHTVKRMLAKEPDQRYQLIHEVRTDLGELIVGSGESEVSAEVLAATPAKRSYLWPAVAGGVMVLIILALVWLWPYTPAPAEGAINSIAILPFENASNDPELEYLSDGIADSIISSLSQIANLKVMSSSAVRRYKGTNVDPQVVAEELGVRAVMLGRILRPGDAFSIRVELVDAQDNTQIWGEQYSRQPDEILSLQEEIAQEISQKLRLQISREEQAQLAVQGTQSPEAYQAYLKGLYHWNQRTEEGFDRAVEYFNEAIAEDPTYAKAYATLADTYYLLASSRTIKEMYPLEMAAALKALEIDPRLAEAHAVMGLIKRHDLDWSGAETAFKRAIELNPNSSRSHHSYANFLRGQRRFDEALSELRKALQEILEIDPRRREPHYWLVRAYWFKGQREDAIAAAERGASLGINRPDPVFLGHVLSGNREEAIRTLENWTGLQPPVRAALYAILGDKDRTIELLENALDEGYSGVVWANVWLEFEPLRDDPRFHDLLRRMPVNSRCQPVLHKPWHKSGLPQLPH